MLDGGEVPRPDDVTPEKTEWGNATAGDEDLFGEKRSRWVEGDANAARDAGREGGRGDGPDPTVMTRASETETVASAAISEAKLGERGVVVKTT